jgi:hypothetical protein
VAAVRVPFKKPWDGSCIVLPADHSDEYFTLDVLVGLREDDMEVVERLLAVVEWRYCNEDCA